MIRYAVQAGSYERQMVYYENIIGKTSNWIFAGIYADEGISRFARYAVDLLLTIRKPKSMNLAVCFELIIQYEWGECFADIGYR